GRGLRGRARGSCIRSRWRVRLHRRRRSRRPARRSRRARRGRRRRRPRRAARPMITHPAFSVEPWTLRETKLDFDVLAQSESVFALANGHIGLRGNLDEGEPNGLPGTYLNSFYELRPLPAAEAVYGNPESGQTIVNVTDAKIIRLLVDAEPFYVRSGHLPWPGRVLDSRAGTLTGRVEWTSPASASVRVTSTRLVSFAQRAVGAILYEVEPIDGPLRVIVQSEVLANEPGAVAPTDD